MKTTIGKAGVTKSWQADFPETTKCVHCSGESRIGFVAHEGIDEDDKWFDGKEFVCNLYENNGGSGGKFWLHDACCVAVYFCSECLEPTALYNQA